MDFLVRLRRDKGFSVSTATDSWSALNSVFALKDLVWTTSREICLFLRNFSKAVKPEKLRPLPWDVTRPSGLAARSVRSFRSLYEHFLAQ